VKTFTFSEARRSLAAVLEAARTEEVLIRRRNGEVFALRAAGRARSPFDVPGIRTRASTADILSAIEASRSREGDGCQG
jgi:hypothetical protein